MGKTTGRFGLRAGEPNRHLAAALPDLILDRAERRQRRGPRRLSADRGLVPPNGFGQISARIGRAPQRLPTGKDDKGVDPAPGNRLGVDEQARGALGGGIITPGCRLGTIFDHKDVAGSGAEVMVGSQAGSAKYAAGEHQSPRHVSPKRLISPRTLRTPVLPTTRSESGSAAEPSRRSVAPRVLTALSCGQVR